MNGPIWYVYNIRDQVTMSSDPLLRSRHQRTFTKYDAFGRQIISGLYICDNIIPEDEPVLQGQYSSTRGTDVYETRAEEHVVSGETVNKFGYTDDAYPSLDNCRPLSVTYYDDYDFNYDGTADFTPYIFFVLHFFCVILRHCVPST